MEAILSRLVVIDPESSPAAGHETLSLLAALVAALRPPRSAEPAVAVTALRALIFLLEHHQDWRDALRRALRALLVERRAQSLFTVSGILPSSGFFSEACRRLGHKMLPEVIDRAELRDVLRLLFPRADDALWVAAVPDGEWGTLLQVLFAGELPDAPSPSGNELPEALRTISYRIAAAGLEPELVRLEPGLSRYESPFVAQNVEVLAYLDALAEASAADASHLLVLIAQCHSWLDRIRRQALRLGTSISLTFQIRRLRQLLKRMERLLDNLAALSRPAAERDWMPLVALFKRLVKAECLRNNFGDYWRQHLSLLALRVTENAGHAGEHYITSDRAEYFGLLRSALLAGGIIALMAFAKIALSKLELAPLTEALAYCLNYGLGFVLIHLLHGTVATKQPAMTANAIAASLSSGKPGDLAQLLDLVARTVRSQLAAILGNIGLAVPCAIAVAWLVSSLLGVPAVDAVKAAHLLHDTHPLAGPALVYAAIAGVCLFLSGLLAGYFDNYAAYERIPERIEQLAWSRRLFGEPRMRRVAAYVGENLGALAGNFFFGFMLGGVWAFGVLFGVLVDIRHVAFSSANLGFALVGSHFAPDWGVYAWAAVGVMLIGAVNLGVSFALAITVALRSRRINVVGGWQLLAAVFKHFFKNPRDFLLPPKKQMVVNQGEF